MSRVAFKLSPRHLVIGLGCVVLLYGYLLLFHDALIDDTFITLNYVKTLTTHGTWGFYSVHTTNTATSPLNVLALSLVTLISRSPIESVFWLTLLEWGALAFFLYRIGQQLDLRWFAPLAFLALVFNPLLISTLGLESTLFAALLTAALAFFVEKRFNAFAIATAFLTLTRPDGFLLYALAFFWLPDWKIRLRATAVYFLCLAPWYLYSWTVLGSFLPDTLLIKVRQSWGGVSFGSGIRLYARRFPLEVVLTLAYVPLALLGLSSVRKWSAFPWLVLLFGAIHFVGYTLLRVPPYHWYYAPEIVCIILLGAFAVAKVAQAPTVGWQRAVGMVVLLLALLTPISGTLFMLARNGVPLQEPFIQNNWATHSQYRAVGLYLKNDYAGKTIPTNGEPGTMAYYCDCYLLDTTFTVRDWVIEDIRRYQTGTRLLDLLFRVNYLYFKPSTPYPTPAAELEVFTRPTVPENPALPHWVTHNSWIPEGLIVLKPN